jgi:glutamine synthetase
MSELDAFLRAHPGIEYFDAFLNDLNTVERGKRLDRAGIAKAFASGLLMPGSMYALDVLGGTVEATGLGFDDGDADRPCQPIPGSLQRVPWHAEPVAQVQLSMFEKTGAGFFGDPRHVLAGVLERFRSRGLTPVVAIEYEFYLVDCERTPEGLPQPPRSPLTGRREFRTQICSMMDLEARSSLLAQIEADCRVQGIRTTSALAEYGPGQFEVNLTHRDDALLACDEALRFKRAVKGVARAHGCEATFLAKPYRDMAGSGLHVHVSLLDTSGRNIFECDEAVSHAPLRNAVGGLLGSLADGMLICAPGPNSYRRFRPEAYVPMTASWSIDNRGSAVRIPVSDAPNRRIEHRLAGADANPYLVVAWILAGIHHGLETSVEPAPPVRGNAYRQPTGLGGETLPTHWATALERFSKGSTARDFLGTRFAELYATLKRAELEDFNSHVTAREIACYLGPI